MQLVTKQSAACWLALGAIIGAQLGLMIFAQFKISKPSLSATGSSADGYPVSIVLRSHAPTRTSMDGQLSATGEPGMAERTAASAASSASLMPDQHPTEAVTAEELSQPAGGEPGNDRASGETLAGGSKMKSGSILNSDFNLALAGSLANALEVRKLVQLNGHAAGSVQLRIASAARIYVNRNELASILADAFPLPGDDKRSFISLDELRDLGIGVRYGAGDDELHLTT